MRFRSCATGFACVAFALRLAGQVPAAQPAVDPSVYLSFFGEAAHQSTTAHAILRYQSTLNGQAVPADLVQPGIQDAIGITQSEAETVQQAGARCESDIATLENDARALVFESRLRAANDEKPTGELAERLKELDAKRIQIILDAVERMKASLGAAQFKVVDEYVRAHAGTGSFFPSALPKRL